MDKRSASTTDIAVKYLSTALLLVGLALFGFLLAQTDLTEVWSRLREVGWAGILFIGTLSLIGSFSDTAAWYLTLLSVQFRLPWLCQLWKILQVGEALNEVTPLASLGGEPVKAALLNKYHAIDYREATASLFLAQTINCIALVLFLLSGMLVMYTTDVLPLVYRRTAGTGLGAFSACILLFFLVQRYKLLSSGVGSVLPGQLGSRVLSLVALIHDVEERLVTFYTDHFQRFGLAVVFAFITWTLGAVEIYYTLAFLGHPLPLTHAWVIEGSVVLIRSTLFIIPANVGTQEGTFILICGAVTGSPALGFAVALIRRFREIVWIGAGLGLGWSFSLKEVSNSVFRGKRS